MARSTSHALPLQTLQQQATALEAAMLEVLAKPAKRSVHKLRTSTRRVEAQLELLAMLPDLPRHANPRQKILRLLKKLRRAAGTVRDLDVQSDLVAEIASGKGKRPAAAIRKEGRELRQSLKQDREKHAEELVEVLKEEKEDLPLAFRDLMEALKSARFLSVSEPDLTTMVATWYAQRSPAAAPPPDDVEHLHDIRKQAKLARYLAESAPQGATRAHRLAARFEKVQEAGGEWHDWLVLAETARKHLGDSAQLPARFAGCAEKSLRVFERRIAKFPAAKLART